MYKKLNQMTYCVAENAEQIIKTDAKKAWFDKFISAVPMVDACALIVFSLNIPPFL